MARHVGRKASASCDDLGYPEEHYAKQIDYSRERQCKEKRQSIMAAARFDVYLDFDFSSGPRTTNLELRFVTLVGRSFPLLHKVR